MIEPTHETIAYYDFTPTVFRDGPGCEQCGHYAEQIAEIYLEDNVLMVLWSDMISCFGGMGFDDTAEKFLEAYKEDKEDFHVDDEFSAEVEGFLNLIKSEMS